MLTPGVAIFGFARDASGELYVFGDQDCIDATTWPDEPHVPTSLPSASNGKPLVSSDIPRQ